VQADQLLLELQVERQAPAPTIFRNAVVNDDCVINSTAGSQDHSPFQASDFASSQPRFEAEHHDRLISQ
jgi:hypothetical protein